MCHILGDIVKHAGLSRQHSDFSKSKYSKYINRSQIVLGSDKDYMSTTTCLKGHPPSSTKFSSNVQKICSTTTVENPQKSNF